MPRAVDELPAALQLSGSEWAERYRFPKPGAGAPVVFQCRTHRRASWAAQLAADAGLGPVFVYKQVICSSVRLLHSIDVPCPESLFRHCHSRLCACSSTLAGKSVLHMSNLRR